MKINGLSVIFFFFFCAMFSIDTEKIHPISARKESSGDLKVSQAQKQGSNFSD